MADYESERQATIARNRQLLQDLGLRLERSGKRSASSALGDHGEPASKRARQTANRARTKTTRIATAPLRTSQRIAAAPKPSYISRGSPSPPRRRDPQGRTRGRGRTKAKLSANVPSAAGPNASASSTSPSPSPPRDTADIIASWTAWTPTAPAPVRADDGSFEFVSHPQFRPNKSPAEILREGAFGGSYFRPLRSRTLGITVRDDWRELPSEWIEGLRVDRFLTLPDYDASVNKFGVACGQSIEEWEANGWIAHEFDVRGWFQWYCRFFQGRRCADDERQVGRWARCVGETGRWRRTLLKKYRLAGVRTVWDDGDDDDDDDGGGGPGRGLSPVVHQTCHHWAWEVRQQVLDELWAS